MSSFYDRTRTISELTLTQTNPVTDQDTINLEIVNHARLVSASLQKNLILGRRDPANSVQPDVDLAPFSGYRSGVSRSHARLGCNEEGYIEITDLGSSNGTYVNSRRLDPHETSVVHNGDLIKLGQLEIIVRYPARNAYMQ